MCRYTDKFLVQLAVFNGPKYPKDNDSFLRVIVSEFYDLSRNGIVVIRNGIEIARLKIHLVMCVGDLPAMASLCHHRTHTARYPCRLCRTEGVARPDGPTRSKYPSRRGDDIRPLSDFTDPKPVSFFFLVDMDKYVPAPKYTNI